MIVDDPRHLITVEGPDRIIDLTGIGRHTRYHAAVDPDGTITLTPADNEMAADAPSPRGS